AIFAEGFHEHRQVLAAPAKSCCFRRTLADLRLLLPQLCYMRSKRTAVLMPLLQCVVEIVELVCYVFQAPSDRRLLTVDFSQTLGGCTSLRPLLCIVGLGGRDDGCCLLLLRLQIRHLYLGLLGVLEPHLRI